MTEKNRYGRPIVHVRTRGGEIDEQATAKLRARNRIFKDEAALQKAMDFGPIGLKRALLRTANRGISLLLDDKDTRRIKRHAAKAHNIKRSRE